MQITSTIHKIISEDHHSKSHELRNKKWIYVNQSIYWYEYSLHQYTSRRAPGHHGNWILYGCASFLWIFDLECPTSPLTHKIITEDHHSKSHELRNEKWIYVDQSIYWYKYSLRKYTNRWAPGHHGNWILYGGASCSWNRGLECPTSAFCCLQFCGGNWIFWKYVHPSHTNHSKIVYIHNMITSYMEII